jgi:hypothetical protein
VAGRSYLPINDLRLLKENAEVAHPFFLEWHGRARQYLHSAWTYLCAIRPIRVRFACALPVLIGARTLRKLDGSTSIGKKISRPEVYWLIIVALTVAFLPPAAERIGKTFGISNS